VNGVQDTLTWRKGFVNPTLYCTVCSATEGTHCFVRLGLDKYNRPIMYACPARSASADGPETVRHIVSEMEHAFREEGARDNWVWIGDMRGISLWSSGFSVSLGKEFVSVRTTACCFLFYSFPIYDRHCSVDACRMHHVFHRRNVVPSVAYLAFHSLFPPADIHTILPGASRRDANCGSPQFSGLGVHGSETLYGSRHCAQKRASEGEGDRSSGAVPCIFRGTGTVVNNSNDNRAQGWKPSSPPLWCTRTRA
jgi:hypothetical protein